MYSFFYIVEEGTTYINEATRIADECVTREFQLNPGEWIPWSELVDTYRGMAVFYDWCHDGLDPGQRSDYADSLAIAAEYQLEEEHGEWASNLAHSKASRLGRLAWGGLALHGDAVHGDLASEMCDSLRAHLYGEHQGQIPFFDAMVGDGGWYPHNVGGVPNVYETETGIRRPAAREDVVQVTHLLDALPNIASVTPLFTPQDVSMEELTLWMYYDTIANTTKPIRAPGVQTAREFIHVNYHQSITPEDIAEAAESSGTRCSAYSESPSK